jgi:hypothetical protein
MVVWDWFDDLHVQLLVFNSHVYLLMQYFVIKSLDLCGAYHDLRKHLKLRPLIVDGFRRNTEVDPTSPLLLLLTFRMRMYEK